MFCNPHAYLICQEAHCSSSSLRLPITHVMLIHPDVSTLMHSNPRVFQLLSFSNPHVFQPSCFSTLYHHTSPSYFMKPYAGNTSYSSALMLRTTLMLESPHPLLLSLSMHGVPFGLPSPCHPSVLYAMSPCKN